MHTFNIYNESRYRYFGLSRYGAGYVTRATATIPHAVYASRSYTMSTAYRVSRGIRIRSYIRFTIYVRVSDSIRAITIRYARIRAYVTQIRGQFADGRYHDTVAYRLYAYALSRRYVFVARSRLRHAPRHARTHLRLLRLAAAYAYLTMVRRIYAFYAHLRFADVRVGITFACHVTSPPRNFAEHNGRRAIRYLQCVTHAGRTVHTFARACAHNDTFYIRRAVLTRHGSRAVARLRDIRITRTSRASRRSRALRLRGWICDRAYADRYTARHARRYVARLRCGGYARDDNARVDTRMTIPTHRWTRADNRAYDSTMRG